MADDEDFSQAPVSLTEHRAKREERAKLWTPRDALINTLRRIDAGELKPQSLVMIVETDSHYESVIATPDMDKTIALLWRGLKDEG